MTTKPLEELIHDLSPQLRKEVRTFVEFLLSKDRQSKPHRLRQDWAGTLHAEGQTSVALQEMLEDLYTFQESYKALEQTGGNRQRAGWVRWTDVRDDID